MRVHAKLMGLLDASSFRFSCPHGGISALISVLWLQTAATTAKVGEAMAKANAAMAAMGATNDPVKVAQTMQQFSKENAKMEMGQEMMDDTLDGVFDDDEVEGETDDLMNQASLDPSVSASVQLAEHDAMSRPNEQGRSCYWTITIRCHSEVSNLSVGRHIAAAAA